MKLTISSGILDNTNRIND